LKLGFVSAFCHDTFPSQSRPVTQEAKLPANTHEVRFSAWRGISRFWLSKQL